MPNYFESEILWSFLHREYEIPKTAPGGKPDWGVRWRKRFAQEVKAVFKYTIQECRLCGHFLSQFFILVCSMS